MDPRYFLLFWSYIYRIVVELKRNVRKHLNSKGLVTSFLKKIIFCIYLLSSGRAGSLLLRGLLCSCGVWASHCGGSSRCRAGALGEWTSVAVALRLQGTGWKVIRGLAAPWQVGSFQIRDRTLVSRIGGRFFTSEPPAKPSSLPFDGIPLWHQKLFFSSRKVSSIFLIQSPVYSPSEYLLGRYCFSCLYPTLLHLILIICIFYILV